MATVLEILARKEERGGNLPEEFELRRGSRVDADVVLRGPNTSLYAVDPRERIAVFADLPPGIDITAAAFSFTSQFEHARRLVQVSFEELERLADAVAKPRQMVFFYNTARSGTTLLHHMLNRIPEVSCLAEVNLFVNLLWHRDVGKTDFGPTALREVLGWCLAMQASPYAGRTVVFKLRHSEFQLRSEIDEAVPENRRIMLYRNALDVGASWKQQASGWGTVREYTLEEIREQFFATSETCEVLGRWIEASPFSALPYEVASLAMWIDGIVPYLEAHERRVPFFTLRYDDLVAKPERSLRKLVSALDLPEDEVDGAMSVLSQDSQAGTTIGWKNGAPNRTKLDADEVGRITEVLAMHPRKLTPQMVLPGTVSP